ncbi:MAG: PAS domain S-box-containing protein [Desulforhopalus sp.]|jgi:PAS domain S-box-containing protein
MLNRGVDKEQILSRSFAENLGVALLYWAMTHINFLWFSNVGLAPMPLWPGAALAIVVLFYRGLRIAPGIFLGVVLADHYTIGLGWFFASYLAVVNTLGPLAGALLMKRRITEELNISGFKDVLFCFFAALFVAPMISAIGGIGYKWFLGAIPTFAVPAALVKWSLGHALAILFIAFPLFIWLKRSAGVTDSNKEYLRGDVVDMSSIALGTGSFLTIFLWFADSVFKHLWFNTGESFWQAFLPVDDPERLFIRGMFCSTFLIGGVVTGKILDRLKVQQQTTNDIAENLHTTLNSIGDAVIVTDNSGRITRMNPVAEQLTGWKFEETDKLPLEDVFNIVNSVTGEAVSNPVRKVFKSGKIVGLANHTALIARDGTSFQISDSAAPIVDRKNVLSGVVLVFRDITEDYTLREQLRLNEERLNLAFYGANDGVWDWYIDQNTFHFDDRYYTMAGYEPKEYPESFHEFELRVHPEDIFAVKVAVEEYIAGGRESFEKEFRFLHKKGHYLWIRAKGKIVTRDENGSPVRFIGTHSDITEKKQAEEALKVSEERFRGIVDSMADWIWEVDSHWRYIYCSDKVQEILGYSPEEMVGKTPFDFMSGEEATRISEEFLASASQKEPIRNMENWNVHKDGRQVCLLTNGVPVLDDSGRLLGFLGVDTDITEQKRAEVEKQKLEFKLQNAQKMESIGTLAGGIAHDFNNILSAVIGYTEIVLDDDLPEDNSARKSLGNVLAAGYRAKDLVKQILAFSRQVQYEKRLLEVGPIVAEVVKLLRASLPSSIEICLNDHLGNTKMFGDPTQLHQILMNLGTNAGHAMRKSGGLLSIDTSVVPFATGNDVKPPGVAQGSYVKISVVDTGPGIELSVLGKIFDPFFTTKPKGEGTGLGLSVVHGIVKDHRGEIIVSSRPGEGAHFTVYLPVAVSFEEVEDHSNVTSDKAVGGDERILLIDDEPAIAEMMQKILVSAGYKITCETDSRRAIEIFRQNPDGFDLVITDQTMPGMTGDQVATELLSLCGDIPIILCTGYSDIVDENTAKNLGVRRFLLKPINQEVLKTSIRQVLDS